MLLLSAILACLLVPVYSVTWRTDPATGKQYTVFQNSRPNVASAKETCASHNAMLPEPRTEAENNFLDSLGSEFFFLGMNDKETEGTWRWDSDNSLVTWQYWAQFDARSPNSNDPNGGRRENCAIMMRNHYRARTVTNTSSWADVPCHMSVLSLLCEKVPGEACESEQLNNEPQGKDNELMVKYFDLMVKNNELMVKYNELRDKDNDLTATYNELTNKVNNLSARYSGLIVKDTQIEDKLNEVKNFQTGTIICGNSDSEGWVKGGWWTYRDITIPFEQAYRNPPQVVVSFMLINNRIDNDDSDDEFGVNLMSVNTNNFTMRCQLHKEKTLQGMKAGWVSLPKV